MLLLLLLLTQHTGRHYCQGMVPNQQILTSLLLCRPRNHPQPTHTLWLANAK